MLFVFRSRSHGLSEFYSIALRSINQLTPATSLYEQGHPQVVLLSPPDESSFLDTADFLLQECRRLQEDASSCRYTHASLAHIGLDTLAFAADHLIRAFSLCGSLPAADAVFAKAVQPTLYTWNSIISVHAELGDGSTCLSLYQCLWEEGFKPDKCTFFAVLKSCAANLMIREGQLIHQHILLSGLSSVEVLAVTLMDMYIKCGCLEDADRVFHHLPIKNMVSWNVLISGYAQAGEGHYALELYKELLGKCLAPNSITIACILKVCCELKAKRYGMGVHIHSVKLGLESDIFVGSATVDMHAEFGNLRSAEMLFVKIPNPNVVLWNVFLKHCASMDGHSVYQLFERMQQQGVKPDDVTFLCVIKHCIKTGDTYTGKLAHDEIVIRGLDSNLSVVNAVIDMYIKFGDVDDGRKVFDSLSKRDIVTWNAMLVGYVEHENAFSVLAFFDEMQTNGMKPNQFTYACVVKACCYTGSINLGKIIHEQILDEKVEVDSVLGSILINMYASCGSPEIAHILLDELPAADALSWNALISGYALCGNTWMVDLCLQDMQSQGLKPNGGTLTSILMACSHRGQVKVGTYYFFVLQRDYSITTNIFHYNSLGDLFCRTGYVKEAEALFQTMPVWPDLSGLTSLLNARTKYGEAKPQ